MPEQNNQTTDTSGVLNPSSDSSEVSEKLDEIITILEDTQEEQKVTEEEQKKIEEEQKEQQEKEEEILNSLKSISENTENVETLTYQDQVVANLEELVTLGHLNFVSLGIFIAFACVLIFQNHMNKGI